MTRGRAVALVAAGIASIALGSLFLAGHDSTSTQRDEARIQVPAPAGSLTAGNNAGPGAPPNGLAFRATVLPEGFVPAPASSVQLVSVMATTVLSSSPGAGASSAPAPVPVLTESYSNGTAFLAVVVFADDGHLLDRAGPASGEQELRLAGRVVMISAVPTNGSGPPLSAWRGAWWEAGYAVRLLGIGVTEQEFRDFAAGLP